MTKISEVYKCNICGNIVEVVHASYGTLVCCGQPMELMDEKTEDIGQEKHVPVVERTGSGVTAKVGSVPHPMEENHYIEWVEVIADGKIYKQFLKPGMEPVAKFKVGVGEVEVREYCNIHGLWKTTV